MSDEVKTRSQLREETAQAVNALSRAELLKQFAISRVSDLTGLDAIGLPVYTCVRALSDTISIHGGKGLDPQSARCGAILEAIEFEAAEHPQGKFIVGRPIEIPEEDRCSLPGPVRSTSSSRSPGKRLPTSRTAQSSLSRAI